MALRIMTRSIATVGITTVSIMTVSITTVSTMTVSITTVSITTLNKKTLMRTLRNIMTLSITVKKCSAHVEIKPTRPSAVILKFVKRSVAVPKWQLICIADLVGNFGYSLYDYMLQSKNTILS